MRKYSICKVVDCDVAHFFKDDTKLKMLPEIKLPLLASFAAAALWLYYNQNF